MTAASSTEQQFGDPGLRLSKSEQGRSLYFKGINPIGIGNPQLKFTTLLNIFQFMGVSNPPTLSEVKITLLNSFVVCLTLPTGRLCQEIMSKKSKLRSYGWKVYIDRWKSKSQQQLDRLAREMARQQVIYEKRIPSLSRDVDDLKSRFCRLSSASFLAPTRTNTTHTHTHTHSD